MPECIFTNCTSPVVKCIPYCEDTAIGEYQVGAGQDIWMCEADWALIWGALSPEEAVKIIAACKIKPGVLMARGLEAAKQILYPV